VFECALGCVLFILFFHFFSPQHEFCPFCVCLCVCLRSVICVQSGCMQVGSVDDYEEFQSMRNAFDQLDFDPKIVFEVFRILSVILNLGNIELVQNPDDVRSVHSHFEPHPRSDTYAPHTHTHTHITHLYTHTHTLPHTSRTHTHITHLYTHTHTHTHTSTHIHTRTSHHSQTHTHTHITHTRARQISSLSEASGMFFVVICWQQFFFCEKFRQMPAFLLFTRLHTRNQRPLPSLKQP